MSRSAAKETMRERILDTAGRLFYGQGIRAIGVDTIAAEIGISKRTLYNYFPSKDDLIVAYLSRHFVPPGTSNRPLLEQILRVFDWLERWFATDTFRGCPFVNAIAELGDATHPGVKMAVAFKEQRRLWLRDALVQLNVADPDGLSTQVAILVEGAIIAALVRGDPAMAGAAKAAARVLLTSAGVPAHEIPEPARTSGQATRKKAQRGSRRKAQSS
ncbi:MAG TPA: TetR/AcrR family transcriptional regulator [Steroidobacteraceae bacterium]|nr:TetR/AcrR family transcriptional regulator [Steroidobacteraceae bacterium]